MLRLRERARGPIRISNGAGRNRRDSLEILYSMLGILFEHGEVSKTKLMNQANLNPLSFQRYIELLENAGIVEAVRRDGKTVYKPTPRAAAFYALLEMMLEALYPEADVLAEYRRLAVNVKNLLESMGLKYDVAWPEAPYADILVECPCGGGQVRLVLCAENDPLLGIKRLLLDGGEDRVIVVYSDRSGCNVLGGGVSLEELPALLSRCNC